MCDSQLVHLPLEGGAGLSQESAQPTVKVEVRLIPPDANMLTLMLWVFRAGISLHTHTSLSNEAPNQTVDVIWAPPSGYLTPPGALWLPVRLI